MSPEVTAALVEGAFNLVITAVSSGVALYISWKWFGVKRANSSTLNALKEIEYLNAVISKQEELTGTTSHQARKEVVKDGLHSTGLFSPAIRKRKLETYQRKVDQSMPFE